MILPYTFRAASHVEAMVTHYLYQKQRPEAVRNLYKTLGQASDAIIAGTAKVFPAPRPYPSLKEVGTYWVYYPPYWIAFRDRETPIISAVHYDASDMPNRG